MINLSELNLEQKMAAETIEGPLLLLAGAGSGKTRTVTYRIAHMVENLGIAPKNILAVSFTNKAASEMKERVRALIGGAKSKAMTLSTFHSLGLQLLKEQITKLGYDKRFSIYDTNDSLAIIREGLKTYRSSKESYDKKQIQSKISFLKNKAIAPHEFSRTRYFDSGNDYDLATEYLYDYYQEKLRFFNAVDFDDILFLTVKLFKQFPEVAKEYSQKFQYIMIDEYQDTNELQFEIVKALTSTHSNICVVGDDDQSIYAFRGADIRNILNFEKQFQNCKVIKLEQNYRSTQEILSLANKVIKQNKKRTDKTMFTHTISKVKPLLWATQDSAHEAAIVVEDIVQEQREGRKLFDFAILYRSNTQIPAIEDQLRLSQLPYKVIGGQKLYEKKEIKDLIAYLCIIRNPKDQISLRRIINVPHRGVGSVTLKKVISVSQERNISFLKSLSYVALNHPSKNSNKFSQFPDLIFSLRGIFKEKGLSQGIKYLVEKIDFYSYIDKTYDNTTQASYRKLDVEQLILSAERFEARFENQATLANFLEKILLADSQDSKEEGEQKNEVTLMTLHSSKGLEFEQVYLIGMEEELLPHKRVIQLGEDIDEERRLCYVGITRAKKKLIMTYTKERKLYGKVVPRHRSRFLLELDDLFTHQDRTTFGHLSEEEAQKYKQDFFADLLSSLD